MRRSSAVLLSTALCALLTVAGCRDDSSTGREYHRYAALGDSFTSGAGLPETLSEGAVCGRTALNYPHLVARAIGAELTDASCGGATTEDGTQEQGLGPGNQPLPPQLDSVTRKTDLVTISLGGNDFGWYLGLMFSCTSTAAADPTGDPCEKQGTAPGTDLTALPPQIGKRLEALLTEVHRKAPGARELAGRLSPARACPRDLPRAAAGHRGLPVRARTVGGPRRGHARGCGCRRGGATSTSSVPSDGHDVCAGKDAWINGVTQRPGVAAAYHPLRQGQAAVAELVEQALKQ